MSKVNNTSAALAPAYTQVLPLSLNNQLVWTPPSIQSNDEYLKSTLDSKYWQIKETEDKKTLNEITNTPTAEATAAKLTPWLEKALSRFNSIVANDLAALKKSFSSSPSTSLADKTTSKTTGNKTPTATSSKMSLVDNFISGVKNSGIWKDYSGADRSFRTKVGEGKDQKTKYDWGAGLQNTLGNLANYSSLVMSFMLDKPTAKNDVNDVATSVRKTTQLALLSSGNPYAMAGAALSIASDKVGGTASATSGLGFWSDAGNTAASFIPFLGFAGADMGKQFESDELKGSSMYAWNSTADGLFNGKILFGKNKAKNLTAKNNLERFFATNILKQGKLDYIGANDPRYYLAAQNELNGGWDLVGRAKQGAILQFSKRTLSKRKYQIGGLIKGERTIDELVDYVKQKNPPFWKRMSGEDRNYIANDDGSVSSLRMTYSHKENDPYVDVYPQVQYNLDGDLVYYDNPIEAYRMAKLRNDVVRMLKKEAETFTSLYKNSSQLRDYYKSFNPPAKDPEIEYNTVTVNGAIPLNVPPEWLKDGGKVNVIPSGALHAHKHHLEEIDDKFEDVTTKGIPVVVESEGGNLIQQAEVEKEEIIFRLDVTKELEKLSKEGTDEAAIKAGKLLVQEILYNTDDKTGEML